MDTDDRVLPEVAKAKPPEAGMMAARALYVAERIDIRKFIGAARIAAQQPATIALVEGGTAIVFRYGAVVFIDGSKAARELFLRDLAPLLVDPYERPETEEFQIAVGADKRDGVEPGTVTLKDASVERLHIVAAVLAKSVALAQYENDVTASFDRIEPFAVGLARGRRGRRESGVLLQHIGEALRNEYKMVARVEVSDRPELLWEHPELEQLYLRLEDEFEIAERAAILDRKLELISRTVETSLDLLQRDQSMRVEWYIVILIVAEIILSVYTLFRH